MTRTTAPRDQRGVPWRDDLARDLRYGIRAWRRNPIFALIAVVTLALGIGANTAIFSLADAVLLRSLPVSNPGELIVLRQVGPAGGIFPFASAAAADLALSRGEDPLRRQILFRGAAASIVGVVKDVRYTRLRADAPLVTYRSHRQETMASADTFLIRTSLAPAEGLTASLRAEIHALAPSLPPPSVVSLEDQVAGALVQERMLAMLSTSAGGLAALLAAIGIYSTVAANVVRRQREIGVRMAVGALPGQAARMVVTDTLTIVAAGLAIGVPAALAAAQAARGILSRVLFQLSPADPLTVFCSAAAILLIASTAAYLPARRASRIDPVAAVKYE